MEDSVRVIPIECKFGPTSAYAYYIDSPEPALYRIQVLHHQPRKKLRQCLPRMAFVLKIYVGFF